MIILLQAAAPQSPFAEVTGNPMLNTIILAIAGYYLKGTADSVREMKKEFDEHKLLMAERHARLASRDDVDAAVERHEELLHGD